MFSFLMGLEIKRKIPSLPLPEDNYGLWNFLKNECVITNYNIILFSADIA